MADGTDCPGLQDPHLLWWSPCSKVSRTAPSWTTLVTFCTICFLAVPGYTCWSKDSVWSRCVPDKRLPLDNFLNLPATQTARQKHCFIFGKDARTTQKQPPSSLHQRPFPSTWGTSACHPARPGSRSCPMAWTWSWLCDRVSSGMKDKSYAEYESKKLLLAPYFTL